ncbi:MAG: putative sigma-54 modulation protein [Candidatus Azotimanducaceae bacterium]|jgi:putative sigma-54 modulation protein
MNIQVNFRDIDKSSAAINQVSKRLSLAFARAKDSIQSVSIVVSDVNGPKGGVDKLCRILIKLAHQPDIVITENQAFISVAINRCITRARQSLSRKLKRNKQSLQQRMKLQNLLPDVDDDMAYPTA